SAQRQRIGVLLSSRTATLALPMIGVVALALALVGGINTSGKAAPTSNAPVSAAGAVTIKIDNFTFIPAHVTVRAGERILVHNEDPVDHTLTAVPGSNPFGSFDTGDIAQGQTKSITAPTKPGTYQYFCSIHNYMTGVITVKPK
ncbi:MAG: cupredoxin domain-containing protein, partial [Vulcanimicrobiaceae bacterium]